MVYAFLSITVVFVAVLYSAFRFGWNRWKVLVELTAVFLLVELTIPYFTRARTTMGSPIGICLNANLRNIQGSKEQWAIEKGKGLDDEPTLAEVAEYMQSGKMALCGEGGVYRMGKVGERPSCSKHGLPFWWDDEKRNQLQLQIEDWTNSPTTMKKANPVASSPSLIGK